MHHYPKRALFRATVVPLVLVTGLAWAAGPARAQGAAHLDSTLTSTATFQVLQLASDVVPLANGLFRWSFRLTNPFGNTTRIGFFTAAPNCDLTQISNIQSPPGWTFQLFRNRSEAPDAPKINWMIAPGQPGPFSPGTPWLNPVFGQNVKLFSFDLPFGANNQSGRAGALNTYGFAGPTLGCQIGDISITGACPPQHQPSGFRVSFRVRFMNRGDVTVTLTRGGQSVSRTLTSIASGDHFLDFNLGVVPAADEIVLTTAVATENGASFTASATSRITTPIVIVPGVQPTDPVDSALASGSPQGLVGFLAGQLAPGQIPQTPVQQSPFQQSPFQQSPFQQSPFQQGQIPQGPVAGTTTFVCPPIIKVLPFCPPNDPLDTATDMLEQAIRQTQAQAGGVKVHLIAHGGGGILSRYYLASRDRTASTVRTLSLVSPPNQGMLLAITSPNRNAFDRYWPAYPFWRLYQGGGLFFSPQNVLLSQVLGFKAPPVPTVVIFGTGTQTPAVGIGSATQPYALEHASGDGVVTEGSATALVGASFIPVPGLKFTNGLSNPTVGQAVLQHILTH